MFTIIFSDLSHENHLTYITSKLKSLADYSLENSANVSVETAAKIAASASQGFHAEVPLKKVVDIHGFSSIVQLEIEKRSKCLTETVDKALALFPNEKVLTDTISFLESPYNEFETNSIVMSRKTNFGTIYIFPYGWNLLSDELEFTRPVELPIPNYDPIEMLSGMGIAGSLAKALVGKAGVGIALAVFSAVFPPGVPSYFTKVYKEIEKIVNKAIKQNEIDTLNGEMNGLKDWSENTYMPQKEGGEANDKALTDMLLPQESDIQIKVIGVLQESSYQSIGLTAFMVGAQMHLAILQELAVVDSKVVDPDKSDWATSVINYTKDYNKYIKTTFESIVKKRTEAISVLYDPTIVCVGAQCHPKDAYRWYDAITKKSGSKHEQWVDKNKNIHSGKARAEADKNKYVKKVIDNLTSDLEDPMSIVKTLKQLETNPIPKEKLA